MLEASAFTPSAKAVLNHSRHQRAIRIVEELEGRILSASLARERDAGDVAAIIEQLSIALRTSHDGATWAKIWTKYCHWQLQFEPTLAGYVASATAMGLEVSDATPLGRAILVELEEPIVRYPTKSDVGASVTTINGSFRVLVRVSEDEERSMTPKAARAWARQIIAACNLAERRNKDA